MEAPKRSNHFDSDRFSAGQEETLGSSASLVDGRRWHSSHSAASKDCGISESLLVLIAGLAIKATSFQITLLISSLTFPIWILHCSLLLAIDPFRTVRRAVHSVRERVVGVLKALLESVSSRLYERIRSRQELGVRLAWGFFWSTYVCLVLVGLLVAAFLAGSMLMRRLAEEPVMIEEGLDFDYTKTSPEALVALTPSSSGGLVRGLGWGGVDGAGKDTVRRLVPPNHRLLLTVSLTLPESDYNRKVGIFQVRADFLSEDGQVSGSSSHPCMLRFKSSHILYLETVLKSGSLLAGYSLESQILNLKMAGFTERTKPTAFIRVSLEQRAKYYKDDGVGIPEIYAASLRLESELPLSKRTLWNWRWTVLIWISTGFFILELMLILVCCRPVILPRTRSRNSPSKELSLHKLSG